MRWIAAPIGLLFGALAGEWAGAFMGAAAGFILGTAFSSKKPEQDERSAAAVEALTRRVERLEQEVTQLRAQVRSVDAPRAVPSAEANTASAPQALPQDPAAAAREALRAQREATLSMQPMPAVAVALPTLPAPAPVPQPAPRPKAVDAAASSLDSLFGDESPAPAQATVRVAAPRTPRPPPPPPAPPPLPLRERMPPWAQQLVFGGNSIVKVGVLILFLGLAFLLRYAAERITTPPELRYAAVALLGMGLLGLGWRLRERRDAAGGTGYGLILQGAGIGVLYLTALAALKVGQLLPPPLAFAFLFGVALLSAVLAVAQNARWLAYVAAAEGFAAPVLVSTGSGAPLPLFSYLAVLNLGILAVAWFKAWRPLNLIGALGTLGLASAWAQRHYSDAHYPVTQGFLIFFFLLFTLVSLLFARRALAAGDEPDERQSLSARALKALEGVGRVDSSLVFGLPLACFGLQYLMVREVEFGPAWSALAFAAVYLLLGMKLLRGASARYALLGEAYAIVGALFTTLAVPLALEGSWTGATWAIQAAGAYWLGLRQHRPYARAFALLLLLLAAGQMGASLQLDLQPGTPLLQGSLQGLLLLAAGALVLHALSRRLPADEHQAWDAAGGRMALWLGLAALALLPWLLFLPLWASVATAGLALLLALLQQRLPALQLGQPVAALHVAALTGFFSSLHRPDGTSMLATDGQGGLAALLIAASLLGSVALPVRAALQKAALARLRPEWSLASSLGWLLGLGLIAMSLLFSWPAADAALAWPWLGVLALALGLRLWQPGLVLGGLGLQLVSGAVLVALGEPLWALHVEAMTVWSALSLALAAGLCGQWLQRAAGHELAWPHLRQDWPHWTAVLWLWFWWLSSWLPQAGRWLLQQPQADLGPWTAIWVLVLLLSTALAVAVAQFARWRVLGQSSAGLVPALCLVAGLGLGFSGPLPQADWGWLAWPLALLGHGLLLRVQTRWLGRPLLDGPHVLGLWLFVLLASRAVQGEVALLGSADSAWPLLGWALVPVALLFAISRPALQQRWPLQPFADAYQSVALPPLAFGLLVWFWLANAHSGLSAPLPFVPLLNPLELGLLLALLALALWWRGLGASARAVMPLPLRWGLVAASAFALYTGAVLRACHHLAGVPWQAEALFGSTLTQAALSVAWSLVGVGLMVLGHRRLQRAIWVAGAALLAVVVLKLFLVELADRGGLYRIVSFIVVGLLLLGVGYFAPVPPARNAEPANAR